MRRRPRQLSAGNDEILFPDGPVLEPAFQDLAHASGVTCLGRETRTRHMGRHSVVRHGSPWVILGRRLRKPDIPRIARELSALQRPRDRLAITDLPTGCV